MGLLDDAIREHLDLKRRRGADPGEIERAEREALGPVRRGPEMTGEEIIPAEDLAPAPAAEMEAEHPPAQSEAWEPFHEDPELHALEEHEEMAPYEPSRAPHGDPLMHDEPLSDEPFGAVSPPPADLSPVPEAEPPPAPHPADPPPLAHPDESSAQHVDQETEEYELEPEADDDVLETTPEFLQDAPEHDRLWFEQRPPRDFDFDG
jgi:hypothetical protein